MRRWSEAEDRELIEIWPFKDREQISLQLGRSVRSVQMRAFRIGLLESKAWTEEEKEKLRLAYEEAGSDGFLNLSKIAADLGRDAKNISRKAGQLGLGTNKNRKKAEKRKDTRRFKGDVLALKEWQRSAARLRVKERHPRGMLGKNHTAKTRADLSRKGKSYWLSLSEEEKSQKTLVAMKAKIDKYGGLPPLSPRGSWKAGWREIGGKRNFYRSRWEANYARYLEWLKIMGSIQEWEHEPETFWFEAIKRGVRSYKPDFRVWEVNGTSCLHEVKGWMDSRSKTTLKRMAKYHPDEKIVLIDGPQYRAIRSKVMGLIPDWEDSKRDSHA